MIKLEHLRLMNRNTNTGTDGLQNFLQFMVIERVRETIARKNAIMRLSVAR
jgi:hypothetical protein